MIYLLKTVCLIIIHTDTTHILDMPCCYHHHQQSYHSENTKIRMLIDILLPLKKVIPIMFERVTKHYKTLQTFIGQRINITSTRYYTRYPTFSPSLTWVGYNATCYHNFNVLPHLLPYIFFKNRIVRSYLQRVTTRYHQIYKNFIFFFKEITVTGSK